MASPYTPYINGSFIPLGNTITFTAATSAPAAVQAIQSTANSFSYVQYRIVNAGGNLTFLGYGNTALIANTNSGIVSSTGSSLPLLPGTVEVLSLPANSYITGVTSTGTSIVYITPGLGI